MHPVELFCEKIPYIIVRNSKSGQKTENALTTLGKDAKVNKSNNQETQVLRKKNGGDIGMSLENFEQLKLENQLCFPLYAAAKEVVRKYKPYLDELDLTYTQYITMMVLWEKEQLNVKELGSMLYLDSGTLTPLLKKLEAKGYVSRHRSQEDERNLNICITEKGEALKEKAASIPEEMTKKYVNLTKEEIRQIYHGLYKLLSVVK